MTNSAADRADSGYTTSDTGTQLYALKIGEKYAVLKTNPETSGKLAVTLFTKEGKRVVFKATSVARGTKIAAFFLEGNPPIIIRCEEILENEPEGMTLVDLPTLGSRSMRTWLGTK